MSASPILTRSRYRVFTRLHWSDPWVVNTYLECIHCTRSAAPAVSTAAFRWRSGTIKREDGTTFEEVIALDFKELFVRVQAITISTDPDTLEDIEVQTTIWVGRMYDEQFEPGGVNAGPYADDVIKAYGLEHELDRITIGKSRVVNDEEDPEFEDDDGLSDGPGVESSTGGSDDGTGARPLEIQHPLVFNEHFIFGFREIGNRSVLSYEKEYAGIDFISYVFGDAGQVWSVRNIVNYLLKYFQRSDFRFVLGGQAVENGRRPTRPGSSTA
jgi:hypothetical protein